MTTGISISLLLGIGIVVGLLLANFFLIEIEQKLNPGHLVNAAATLIVALLLNQVFQRHASRKGVERELLLEHVQDVKSSLSETYHAFLTCPVGKKLSKEPVDAVSRAERRFSNTVHSLEIALKCCKVRPGKSFESVKEARFVLKEVLTDDPFPAGIFTAARASQIQGAFKVTQDALTELLFAVNKACQ